MSNQPKVFCYSGNHLVPENTWMSQHGMCKACYDEINNEVQGETNSMSNKLTFYTVATDKPGYPVRWLDPTEQWASKRFTGPFGDPGQASQEFQNSVRPQGHEPCYLDEHAFAHKRNALAKVRKQQNQERELLAAWK